MEPNDFHANIHEWHNNCFFIIYEELTNPNYVKMLLEKINFNQVENLNLNYFKNSNKKEIDIGYAKDAYDNAKDIYMDFKHKFMHLMSSVMLWNANNTCQSMVVILLEIKNMKANKARA